MPNRSRVQAGLLDFEYCASFHIEHPHLNLDEVSTVLQRSPDRARQAGDARQTPTGTSLAGTYSTGHWTCDLEVRDGDDVAQFLERIVSELCPAKELLQRIVDDGGRVECFVGLFAKQLCDQVLPSHLLLKLGQLGIDLRLDYYKSEDNTD